MPRARLRACVEKTKRGGEKRRDCTIMTREKDVHTFFCGHKPGAMPRCPSPARRAPRIRGVYVCRRVDTHESRINNTVQIKLLNQTPNTSKKKIKEDQKVLPGTRNPDRIYVFYCCSQPNRTTQSLNFFFFSERAYFRQNHLVVLNLLGLISPTFFGEKKEEIKMR